MAARLTDKQKKKIVADYLECQSVNLAARKNGVSWDSAKKALEEAGEIEKKLEQKKEETLADILASMESGRQAVCDIIEVGLEVLPDKIRLSNRASDVTTVMGTLIDKWTGFSSGLGDTAKEDALSQSLREMANGLASDD